MDSDEQPNRRRIDPTEEHAESEAASNERKLDDNLMGAYDEVEGRSMFIIAAIDSDNAWLAIPDGATVDRREWC